MRILLVKPPFARLLGSRTYMTYPLGIMYVAAMLRDQGHEVRCYHDDVSNPAPLPQAPAILGDVQMAPLTDDVCAPYATVLDSFQPDVVGISYTTADWVAAHAFAKMAMRRGCRVVAGGIHASLCAINEADDFDAVVVGEGDAPAIGRVFTGDEVDIVTANVDSLDRYLPARDSVIGHEKYPPYLRGHIATQRGCPYACAYCAAPTVFGTKVRTRDPQKVRSEVDSLGVKQGRIIDDSFGVVRSHGEAVCDALHGSGFKWICDTAVQQVDAGFAEMLVRGGCEKVCMGVESVTPRLRELSGKHFYADRPEEALGILRGAGIKQVAFYFMVGFPGETAAEMHDTLAWAHGLKDMGAEPCISIVTPYPGTKLWDLVPAEQRPSWREGLIHQSGKMRYGAVTAVEWDDVIKEAREL